MIKLKITFYLFLFSIIISCNNKPTLSPEIRYKKAKEFCMEFNDMSFDKLIEWNIYQRWNSLFIFSYKKQMSFLIKDNIKDYKIRDMFPNDKPFIEIGNYSEKDFLKFGLTKRDVLDVININYKIGASKIFYVESFKGIVIEKNDFRVMYLLSNKFFDKLPKVYSHIHGNWYYYPDGSDM